MIRRPPRSTQSRSSAASDVYKRQLLPPAMNASAESRCYQGLRVSTRRSVNNPAQPHQPWNCSRLKGQTTLSTTIRLGWSSCLLYTSDAADDLLCVDLGGRRIIKKKK